MLCILKHELLLSLAIIPNAVKAFEESSVEELLNIWQGRFALLRMQINNLKHFLLILPQLSYLLKIFTLSL